MWNRKCLFVSLTSLFDVTIPGNEIVTISLAFIPVHYIVFLLSQLNN